MKKANNLNISLEYLLLGIIEERFNKKKALLNYFNRFWI